MGVDRDEFNEVVEFHGCYCLDIAMGYRIAKALVREMGEHMADMKKIFGHVGADTCSVDAFQKITGCTAGKRNLIFSDLGKPVYILQNTASGKALRAYCHYWDNFDHTEIRQQRKAANAPGAGEAEKAAFKAVMDRKIDDILQANESELFTITEVQLPSPPKSSKYKSEPCDNCGESTKAALLREVEGRRLCGECALEAVS